MSSEELKELKELEIQLALERLIRADAEAGFDVKSPDYLKKIERFREVMSR